MMVDPNLFNSPIEDTFMLAATRLEAGEAIETVLADFPEEERDELRELLTVVAATHHLQESDIPHPVPERRAANKRAFLQAAAEFKTAIVDDPATAHIPTVINDIDATSTQAVVATPAVVPTPVRKIVGPTWGERLQAVWGDFLRGLAPATMRLAPLAIMLVAIWLASFGAVSAAKAANLDDITYPAKKWILYQELTLAAPEDRSEVYAEIESILANDVQEAATRGVIAEQTAEFIFHGVKGDYLHVGPFYVETSYPSASDPGQTTSIILPTDRVIGKDVQVRLVYRTISGNDAKTEEGRLVVQGVSLAIIEDPVQIPPTAVPTSTPTMTATATLAPTATKTCAPWRPTGWVAYTIQTGETLSTIAANSGTTTSELAAVNCITNLNLVRSGARISVPRLPYSGTPAPVTTTNPNLVMTLTAVTTTTTTIPALTPTTAVTTEVTAVATPVGITPTVTISDTTGTLTPVPTSTTAITVTATVVVTATNVSPATTPTATIEGPEATPVTVVTGTVMATPISTVDITPSPIEETTPAVTPTPAPAEETPDTGEESTPIVEETPTINADAAEAEEATTTPVETVAATPTPEATVESDSGEVGDGSASEMPEGGVNDSDGGTSSDSDIVGGTSDGGSSTDGGGATTPVSVETSVVDSATTVPAMATSTPVPTVVPTIGGQRNGESDSGGSTATKVPTSTPTPINRSPISPGG